MSNGKTVLDKDLQNKNKAAGMARAEESAGMDWQDAAVEYVKSYPDDGKEYKMEDNRLYNEEHTQLINPPTNWSYGPLAVRCVKEGIIIIVGRGPCVNSKSHGAYVDIYKKAQQYRVNS
ncbi:MAG: hypothetical protein V3U75_06435 [Methylococcaceae bacterium]